MIKQLVNIIYAILSFKWYKFCIEKREKSAKGETTDFAKVRAKSPLLLKSEIENIENTGKVNNGN